MIYLIITHQTLVDWLPCATKIFIQSFFLLRSFSSFLSSFLTFFKNYRHYALDVFFGFQWQESVHPQGDPIVPTVAWKTVCGENLKTWVLTQLFSVINFRKKMSRERWLKVPILPDFLLTISSASTEWPAKSDLDCIYPTPLQSPCSAPSHQ